MKLLPAVDIRGGRAVRLRQGDFDSETVYAADPLHAARRWVEDGARSLHVVDLDGALRGEPVNLEHLERIAELGVPVQYGGGLRSMPAVRRALEAGAERAVVGSAAYRDERFLASALQAYDSRIVVAVDARDGRVSLSGWTEAVEASPEEVIPRLLEAGVSEFAYTSVARDGTLDGPDVEEVTRVAAALRGRRFLYSGGIGALRDLEALRGVGAANLAGVIVGKALYERRFTVGEGHAVLDGG